MRANRNLTAVLIAAALAALAGNAIAQAPAPAAGQQAQVVRPADLLTQEERDNFRKQMQQAASAEERQKVRDAHRAAIEQRAKEQGVAVPAPGSRAGGYGPGRGRGGEPGYGPRGGGYSQLFTTEERSQFRDRMHAAATAEERQALRDEHRALAEARAKEKGITLPPPGPRAGGMGPGRGPGAGPGQGRGAHAQLFTVAERSQFRDRMHAAATAEERQALRDEHRALAEARAKEQGITLPPRGARGPRGPAPAAPAN